MTAQYVKSNDRRLPNQLIMTNMTQQEFDILFNNCLLFILYNACDNPMILITFFVYFICVSEFLNCHVIMSAIPLSTRFDILSITMKHTAKFSMNVKKTKYSRV